MMILILLFSAKATPVSLATTYFTVLTLAFFFGRLSMFKFSTSNLHYSASSSLVSAAPKNRPIFSLGFSLCFAALSFSLSYVFFSPFLAYTAGSFLPLLFHYSLTAMGYRSFISSRKPPSIPTSRMGRSASAIFSSLLQLFIYHVFVRLFFDWKHTVLLNFPTHKSSTFPLNNL